MLPPVNAGGGGAPAPVHSQAPAQAPAADSSVAGASGGAAQAAGGAQALAGSGSLAAVLQQLTDAVKALSAAIGGTNGGGPIQAPPGTGGISGGGGADVHPLVALEQRLAAASGRSGLSAAAQADYKAVRAELATIRSESRSSGAFSPMKLLRARLMLDRLEQPAGSAARRKLDAIIKDVPKVVRNGSSNPAMLHRFSLEASLATGKVMPGREADARRVIADAKAMEGSRIFDPLEVEKLYQASRGLVRP